MCTHLPTNNMYVAHSRFAARQSKQTSNAKLCPVICNHSHALTFVTPMLVVLESYCLVEFAGGSDTGCTAVILSSDEDIALYLCLRWLRSVCWLVACPWPAGHCWK